jgi:hypothetical protein
MFTGLDAKRLPVAVLNPICTEAAFAGADNLSTCPAVLTLFDDRS